MNYQELIHNLYTINQKDGVKFGLENILRLSKALNHPEKKFASIHVAGSNGKGSVVTMIAKAIEYTGKRVGLYTSPHISSFRERIRINGTMIPEQAVAEILDQIFEVAANEHIHPTFFEITTLLAFIYFAREKVDVAVLETGLGGRLDATNIVIPVLSIITSISLEHTDVLGKTIEAIALEKAGIIKPDVPVVIGPRVPLKIIEQVAEKLNSPLIQVEGNYRDFREENKAIAKTALELLKVDTKAIDRGLEQLPSCRMETFQRPENHTQDWPEAVILDVAHNPDGLEHLFSAIRERYPDQLIRGVCGLSKNKDVDACLNILVDNVEHFHLVEATNGRGVPVEELYRKLVNLGISINRISIGRNIEESVKTALKDAYAHNEIVVISGTFFIMSAARSVLGIEEPRDPVDMNESLKQV